MLDRLLEGGHSKIAGRLAGAFRNIGRDRIADDIVNAMRAAGYSVREQDPFKSRIDLAFPRREASPHAGRIRLMWQQMRGPIIEKFPAAPGRPKNIDIYLKQVQDVYVTDAYHSLSIEGYRVSPVLIERVRRGTWNPMLTNRTASSAMRSRPAATGSLFRQSRRACAASCAVSTLAPLPRRITPPGIAKCLHRV